MYYTTLATKVNPYFVEFVAMRQRASELDLLLPHICNAQVRIGLGCHTAPARGSGQKAPLQKIRLVHILQRDRLFIDRRGKRIVVCRQFIIGRRVEFKGRTGVTGVAVEAEYVLDREARERLHVILSGHCPRAVEFAIRGVPREREAIS